MQHQLQKLLSKQKLKIWLIFVFVLAGQLSPLSPLLQHTSAADIFDPAHQAKITYVADNALHVEIINDDTVAGLRLKNLDSVKGNYIDSDPTDGNHEWVNPTPTCGSSSIDIHGKHADAHSVIKQNGNSWNWQIVFDTNVDSFDGCTYAESPISPPGGDIGAMRDQAYWLDRTAVKYKNAIYKVYACNPYRQPKQYSTEDFINTNNLGAFVKQRAPDGGQLAYVAGGNDSQRGLVDVSNAGGTGTFRMPDGLAFTNLNVVENGFQNSATDAYKLDDSTVLVGCGLKTGSGGLEEQYVEHAVYKKPAQDAPGIQDNPDRKDKFFRVEGGNVYYEDYVQLNGGSSGRVSTTSTGSNKLGAGTTFYHDIVVVDAAPPAELYGDKADIIAAANKGLSSANAANSTNSQDIECAWSVNPLTWLMCPLIAAANMAVNQLDAGITHELTIDTDQYLGDNATGNSFKAAWSSFRYIALALLVIAALVMILSQALSIDILDAYTIKKVLPRLLVAILLISISWPLMKFAIDISNHLGQGVRALVYAPFQSLGPPTITGGTSTLGFLGVAAIGTTLGILGILSFVLTALLAVIIAFGVLVLRKMVILMLVVVAPIAIVAYILPGTQKVWKIWYDFFLRALLVFPIISLFIAAGRVFAQVAAQTDPGILGQFIVFIAYFGPYFALPTAFRLAGGAIANISGVVNDRGKGAFDRLSKYRSNRTAENVGKLKTGDRFQGRNAVTRQFNKRSAGVASGWSGHFGVGARGEAFHDLHGRAAVEDAIRNDHNLRQLGYDDNAIAIMALSGGTRAGAERAANRLGLQGDARTRALESAAAVGFTNTNALAGLTLMAQNKSRALTGDLGGEAGMELVRQSAEEASGGNRQLVENTMGGFAFNSRNAGRYDLGGETAGRSLRDGWQRASVQQHVQAFGASTQAFANQFVEDIHNPNATNGQKRAAAVALSEMQNALPGASAENQTIINQALAAAGVDHNAGISTEQQLAYIASGYDNRGQGASITPATNPNIITAAEIHGLARQYGTAVPEAQRGQPGQPQPPPPPQQQNPNDH